MLIKKIFNKLGMMFAFVITVFIILILTIFFVIFTIRILIYTDIVDWTLHPLPFMPFIALCFFSLLFGTILSIIMGHVVLKPIREVIGAANELAEGKFDTRIDLKGPVEFKQLSTSFNHMAKELGNTEMLRSDFINNFSHEFKTPIVSLRGFAKVLKYDELTLEERNEYLDIIISESERLAALSTNVLKLSKIEHQAIITNIERFNISEQIRRSIAILGSKWNVKNINFDFDGDEIYIDGNEELLSEVWLNLLDNAIKFTKEGTIISIKLERDEFYVTFEISDCGSGMDEQTRERVFDKFYQGDTSHSGNGNGLGLTISRNIIELHKGTICVKKSDLIGTTFQVILPV